MTRKKRTKVQNDRRSKQPATTLVNPLRRKESPRLPSFLRLRAGGRFDQGCPPCAASVRQLRHRSHCRRCRSKRHERGEPSSRQIDSPKRPLKIRRSPHRNWQLTAEYALTPEERRRCLHILRGMRVAQRHLCGRIRRAFPKNTRNSWVGCRRRCAKSRGEILTNCRRTLCLMDSDFSFFE